MSAKTHKRQSEEPVDVLLVEDNPGDARLAREAFGSADGETTLDVVTDGDDAVEHLLRDSRAGAATLPDLVLLDLNLPGRDGHEILDTIRCDSRLRRLPVVMLTSSRAAEDVEKCYDADANAYLSKPTDPDEFVDLAEAVQEFWFEHVHLPPLSE